MPAIPERRRRAKVIEFGDRPGPHNVPLITQRELISERQLAKEAARAAKELQQKRDAIKKALKKGAVVEEGVRSAQLILRFRRPRKIKGGPYQMLLIR